MKKKAKAKSTWEWIFAFAGMRKKDFWGSVALAAVSVICGMIPYFILAGALADLYGGERDFVKTAGRFLLMLLFWCLAAIFHGLSTAASHRAAFAVLGNMRKMVCDRLAELPLGKVMAQPSGSLKNTLAERIDSIETVLAHVLPEFTSSLLAPLITFIYLLSLDWRMALAGLVTLPPGFVCMAGMMKDYDASSKKCINASKELNDTAVEYIGGMDVIRVFGRGKSAFGRFSLAAERVKEAHVAWMRRCNAWFSMAMAVMPASVLGVLPLGGILVKRGMLSPASFIVCIILSLGLIQPVITMMSYTDDLAALKTVLGEVTAILESPAQVRPEKSEQVPGGSGIVFSDVHFRYKEKEVLHGVSLEIREGEVTALVGPSGSGKSTIARLAAGLWDVSSGEILLGGADIRRLSSEDFQSRVSFVSQNPYLFSDTIRENIRMGRPGASDREVEDAARACGCHEYILSLEKGYETMAAHLSGGERQRIAIARAMLKNAGTVILDEATAYMDPENEALIEQAISKLAAGKTLLVIAHRLSTITGAGHIAVIADGRVVQEGLHEQLLEEGGLYADMWKAHTGAGREER